jgi:uncharacterized membrane protein
MSRESKLLAGVLLVSLPTVMFGGMALLTHIVRRIPGYLDNPVRQDLWRAGHAHAGVYLVLALVMLRYVDEAALSPSLKWFARLSAPIAAILIPAAFFGAVLLPGTTEPNGLIYLAYPGAAILALGVLTLGIGLVQAARGGTAS